MASALGSAISSTETYVDVSSGVTPKSMAVSTRLVAIAAARPIDTPVAESRAAPDSTRRATSTGFAPSAARRPNSAVRCAVV